MQVQFTSSNGHTIVKVQGRIDTITAGEFESSLQSATAEANPHIIIDCEQMDYISSSGLRVFLVLQKKVKSMNGKLKLCGLQPTIGEIFQISGFSAIFSIYSDVASSIAG